MQLKRIFPDVQAIVADRDERAQPRFSDSVDKQRAAAFEWLAVQHGINPYTSGLTLSTRTVDRCLYIVIKTDGDFSLVPNQKFWLNGGGVISSGLLSNNTRDQWLIYGNNGAGQPESIVASCDSTAQAFAMIMPQEQVVA